MEINIRRANIKGTMNKNSDKIDFIQFRSQASEMSLQTRKSTFVKQTGGKFFIGFRHENVKKGQRVRISVLTVSLILECRLLM